MINENIRNLSASWAATCAYQMSWKSRWPSKYRKPVLSAVGAAAFAGGDPVSGLPRGATPGNPALGLGSSDLGTAIRVISLGRERAEHPLPLREGQRLRPPGRLHSQRTEAPFDLGRGRARGSGQ